MTGCHSWRQPHAWDAVSNSSKYNILAGTQLIRLYKFVCTISTQNSNINLHCELPFSRLSRLTWAMAVIQSLLLTAQSTQFNDIPGSRNGSDAILLIHHKV